jgi:hypothetical protein
LADFAHFPHLIRIDKDRVEIILERLTRGFYYHYVSAVLPNSVLFEWAVPKREPDANGAEMIRRLESNLRTIRDGQFRYAFEFWNQSDPFATIWLMRFYNTRTFFCFTASGTGVDG